MLSYSACDNKKVHSNHLFKTEICQSICAFITGSLIDMHAVFPASFAMVPSRDCREIPPTPTMPGALKSCKHRILVSFTTDIFYNVVNLIDNSPLTHCM